MKTPILLSALILCAFSSCSKPPVSDPPKLKYPASRNSGQADEFFGIRVADPYRWLEDADSAETRAWIEAQNKLTFAYLDGIPERARIKKRLTQIWDYERCRRRRPGPRPY